MKRVVAFAMCIVLVVGLLPAPAYAGEKGGGGLTASQSLATAADGDAGNSYFVATNGSDDNPGTFGAPFATIAHAASVMQAGDTCYVRGGTYRELLSDHNRTDSNGRVESPTIPKLKGTQEAPFTFQAYKDEKVTLTGADPITGWTKVEGSASNIWRAPMGWDMYCGH